VCPANGRSLQGTAERSRRTPGLGVAIQASSGSLFWGCIVFQAPAGRSARSRCCAAESDYGYQLPTLFVFPTAPFNGRFAACDGYWREADFYGFLREECVGIWECWPELIGLATRMIMTIRVCLCGTPFWPTLGGVRGGHTPNAELHRLMESSSWARNVMTDEHALIAGSAPSPVSLEAMERRLVDLQRAWGRRNRSGPGRYWELPTRRPESGGDGTLTRDGIALQLQQRGLTFAQAHKVVSTLLQVIMERVAAGEKVTADQLGTFYLKEQPKTQHRFRLNKFQTLFKGAHRMSFRPAKALQMVLRQPGRFLPKEAAAMPAPKQQFKCERCD